MTKEHQKFVSIRVTDTTKDVIDDVVGRVNAKELGKKVKADDVIEFSLRLLTEAHVAELQESSLSNTDRLEMHYREHVKQYGPISKDDFIGRVLRGDLGSGAANS